MNRATRGQADVRDVIEVLEARLARQRLSTRVGVELGVMLVGALEERYGLVALVAADVVDRWTALAPVAGDRPALSGPDGFTASYVSAVEYDAQGRPHPRFYPRGGIVDGWLTAQRWVYAARVWAHHARWLARLATPLPVLEQVLARVDGQRRDQATRVHHRLVVEWWRTRAAVALGSLLWDSLDRDLDKVVAVAADVVDSWLACGGVDRQPLCEGSGGFVDEYFGRVTYLPAPNGQDENWRPEFLPDDPGVPVDEPAYERAVWQAHVATLAGAR